jgi:ribosomal protein L37AE/L43A
MSRLVECPKCGKDISDTYEGYDPSVGIMSGGWYCEQCDVAVADEGYDDDSYYE